MTKKIHTGEVAWYVAGQFYIDSNGQAFDCGYFTSINGIEGAFFEGDIPLNAAKAYFTFSAMEQPFTGTKSYSGTIPMTQYTKGDWKLYLKNVPGADYQWPQTFSENATHIATFHRGIDALGDSVGWVGTSVLSFKLVWSVPFEFNQQTYDFKDLIPHGVTQFGSSDGQALPATPQYPTVTAFVGSAIALGKPV